MPFEEEKFIPCSECKATFAERGVKLEDMQSWVFLCDACRNRRQEIRRKNMVRKAQDPVAGAFHTTASLSFQIEGLREQIVSMFSLREDDLRARVQVALEAATSEENLDRLVREIVDKELREMLRREIEWGVKKAINEKIKGLEGQIDKHVKEQLESAWRYGIRH